jgi:glycosyltransferase involved in cell wall biosynthesis
MPERLPRISIITPSFNQAQYIEETIQSVLSQDYPNIEYVVIDGGSTDGSEEIIRRYAPQLAYWISEPDRGQSHAINKGFTHCTGDLVAWLNSDDVYLPGALRAVGEAYAANPERIIAGAVINHWEESGREKVILQQLEISRMLRFWSKEWSWHQPGIFFPRSALTKVGSLEESLHYCMDYDLVLRVLPQYEVSAFDQPLVRFRVHESAKGGGNNFDEFLAEWSRVSKRYWPVAGYSDSREHDAYMSYRLALLFGQRLRQRQFRQARRALVNAARASVLPRTLAAFSHHSVNWMMARLTRT